MRYSVYPRSYHYESLLFDCMVRNHFPAVRGGFFYGFKNKIDNNVEKRYQINSNASLNKRVLSALRSLQKRSLAILAISKRPAM
ncbi:hypothetical protein BN1805_01897 [Proteus vulgaris]|nr:hypothetical protein BN1805_01897 [Proteus vulgaris]